MSTLPSPDLFKLGRRDLFPLIGASAKFVVVTNYVGANWTVLPIHGDQNEDKVVPFRINATSGKLHATGAVRHTPAPVPVPVSFAFGPMTT